MRQVQRNTGLNATMEARKILIKAITSTKYLDRIQSVFKPELLPSSSGRTVGRWISDYYSEFKTAPQEVIQEIHQSKINSLSNEDADLIGQLLHSLDGEYSNEDSDNLEYHVKQTEQFFKSQALQKNIEEVSGLLSQGQVDEAILSYSDLSLPTRVQSGWESPLDDMEFIHNTFDAMANPLMTLKGNVGKLLGPLESGWLVAVLAPMKRGKSEAESTEIVLSNGEIKTIKEIVESNETFKPISLKSNGRLVPSTISEKYDNGEKTVYKMTTRTGRENKSTEEHLFLSPTKWKKLSDFAIDDFIATPKEIKGLTLTGTLPECELKVLAYLLADGCLVNPSPVFTKKDPIVASDFGKAVSEIGDNCILSKVLSGIKWFRIASSTGEISKNSNTRKMLRKHGLNFEKSKDKFIPKEIFKLKKNLLSLFLRTLFTCDGSFEKSGQVSYSSTSKKLISQVQHLLLRFGIISLIKEIFIDGKVYAYELLIRDNENVIKYIKKIGFISIKQEKAKNFLKQKGLNFKRSFLNIIPFDFIPVIEKEIKNYCSYNKTDRSFWNLKQIKSIQQAKRIKGNINRKVIEELSVILESDVLKEMATSDIFWDKIKKIEKVGKERTYDIEIPEHHNFIANDFVVHNSWWLQEIAMESVTRRLNTAFFTLEMSAYRHSNRFFKQIVSQVDGIAREIMIPYFDCKKNSANTCRSTLRTNKFQYGQPGYTPCTSCRNMNNNDFQPCSYLKREMQKALNRHDFISRAKAFTNQYGKGRFKLKNFPSGGASVEDIEASLNILEQAEGFTPEVVIVDYANLLKVNNSRLDKRDQVDYIWRALKGLGEKRNCLVVTAHQGTRKSIESQLIKQTDTSEDIRVVAHVDLLFGLSQTTDEQQRQCLRMNVLAHRWKWFSETLELMVLHQHDISQPYIDSAFVPLQSGLILD